MATIKDIAQAANVSPAAVSRILNGDTSLSVTPETRVRVQQVADNLGYIKQPKAGNTPPVLKLGIVQWFSAQQELEDSYYLLIRQGIEDFCSKNEISIIRTFRSDLNYTDALKDADAIICIGKFSNTEVEYFQKMTKNILFLDMPLSDPDITNISIDFEQALHMVCQYLQELGHKQIGFLTGREYLSPDEIFPDKRHQIFVAYCEEHGIEYLPYLKTDEFTTQSGYAMMNELIASKTLPTAVFAASDPIAIGALKALTEHQIRVPEDISLIGFDNTNITNFTAPPLTTVHAPAYDMGYIGAGIIFTLMQSPVKTALKIQLPCKLVIRDSCASICTSVQKEK